MTVGKKGGQPTKQQKKERDAALAIQRSIDRLPGLLDMVTERAVGGNVADSVTPQLVTSVLRLVEIVPGFREGLGAAGVSADASRPGEELEVDRLLAALSARVKRLEAHFGKPLRELLPDLTEEIIAETGGDGRIH